MKKLTAYNKDNEREIEMMVSKAMCAYANAKDTKNNREELERIHGKEQVNLHIGCLMSEYEATVRILDFFVRESIYELQNYIISRCEEEFAI